MRRLIPRWRGVLPRRLKTLVAVLLVWLSLCATPAYADTQSISSVLSPFDLTDSHGIHISQFALNINMGNAITSTWKLMLSPLLIGAWSLYSWGIGFVAWVLDLTLDLSWASYITSAFSSASSAIRGSILEPIGATGYTGAVMSLLLSFGAIAVVWTMHRRGFGSGVASALWTSLAASLAVGALALPVTSLAGGDQIGKPLQYARGLSLEAMAAVSGHKPPADARTDALPDDMKPSAVLIDTFVRLPHQEYNYGTQIDGGTCEKAYDAALKKGPVEASSDTIRSAVGDCDSKLKKYADNPDYWWLFVQAEFGITGSLLTALVCVLLVLTWMSVMLLSWAAFKTTYHAMAAIVSTGAWGALVTDLVDVGVSLLQVITAPTVLAIGLKAIKAIFGTGSSHVAALQSVSLAARYVFSDGLLVGTVVLLLLNWKQQRRWGKKLWRKIAAHTPAQAARPSTGRNMVTGIIGAEAGRVAWQRYRAHSPSRPPAPVPTPHAGPTRAPAAVTRATTHPAVGTGVQLAALAAGTATGGAAPAALHTAGAATRLVTRYRAITQGQQASGLTGNALVAVARGHNYVTSRRNQVLNTLDERVDNGRTLARPGGNTTGQHGQEITTGSTAVDTVLASVGRTRRRVGQTVGACADVVNAARTQGRRGQQATTGHDRLDKVLGHAGRARQRADRTQEFLTIPRSAIPAVPRTRPATPRRTTDLAPRRGATRAPRPAGQTFRAQQPVQPRPQPGPAAPRQDRSRPATPRAPRAPRPTQVNPVTRPSGSRVTKGGQ